MSNKSILIIAVLSFVAGVVLGYYIWIKTDSSFFNDDRVEYSQGKLTSPLLECREGSKEISIGNRAAIEKKVAKFVNDSIAASDVDHISVYFRDLNNGPWFGINEREEYIPGSLLKLPLALSFYFESQWNPSILEQEVEYVGSRGSVATENDFSSDASLAPGIYSVSDLIKKMLVESNNEATLVLANIAGEERTKKTFRELGIQEPIFGKDYSISAKSYGAFFRVLYNASYIGQPYSEQILQILTQSLFKDGIVAGVPSSVVVAHKFGTRSTSTDNEKQLHDCGIIYAANEPYILCVMTRGSDLKKMSNVIAGISSRIYEGVVTKQ